MAVLSVFEGNSAQDSPSRQLLWELQRLVVTTQEENEERLSREYQKREIKYKTALADAIARHERVRENAEAEKARLERQIQEEQERIEALMRKEEQRQKQAEKQAALERIRLEAAAKLLKEQQAARQKAEQDRQEAETAKAVETAKVVKALKEKQESDAKAKAAEDRRKADSDRKTKEAAVANAQSSQRPQAVVTSDKQPAIITSQAPARKSEVEVEHDRYLEIHQRLKKLRHFMDEQAKQNLKLKTNMGDMRRDIRKCVGQLVEGGGKANQGPVR